MTVVIADVVAVVDVLVVLLVVRCLLGVLLSLDLCFTPSATQLKHAAVVLTETD
jgi:hypothetical protein